MADLKIDLEVSVDQRSVRRAYSMAKRSLESGHRAAMFVSFPRLRGVGARQAAKRPGFLRIFGPEDGGGDR